MDNMNYNFNLENLESYKTLPKVDEHLDHNFIYENNPIEIPMEICSYNVINININISKLNINNNYPIKFNINII